MEKVTNTNYKTGFIPYAIAAFMVGLSGGFTAGLGPAFVADLGIDYGNTTWISLTLAMSTAACAPILGKLGDIFGRRKTLLTGMLIFILGNILTAISTSLPFMLGARFIVGIGTAAVTPIIMAYIVTEYPQEEMGKAFGLYMLISSGAVVVGPTLGGVIMELYGWRIMMWVATAMCAIAYIVCSTMIKKTPFERKELVNFDKIGGGLVVVFFSLFLCIPSFGQNIGWSSWQFITATIIAIIALIGLVVAEKKAVNPILNSKFMFRKEFILPVLILFLTQGLMQANMTNVIVFIRYTQPDNVIISSLATSIMYIGMCIGSVGIGPLADKKEPKSVLTFSLLLTGVGCSIMYFFTAESSVIIFAAALGILGIGLGGNATIFMKVALNGLTPEIAGLGTGTYNLFKDISAPFGVAVFVPLFTNTISKHIASGMANGLAEGEAVVKAAISSIKNITVIEIGCIIVGIIIVQILPKIHENKSIMKDSEAL